jgi:hypothetical protein
MMSQTSAHSSGLLIVLLGVAGCVSAGDPPPTPAAWTPGRYLLEASVGATLSAEEFTGELIVRSVEDIVLQSTSGLCEPTTPAEVQRDRAQGMRTFNCGPARWEIRPTPGGVRGTIRATILEEYREETQCPPGQAPPCTIMRTRQVTRNANLRVSPMN